MPCDRPRPAHGLRAAERRRDPPHRPAPHQRQARARTREPGLQHAALDLSGQGDSRAPSSSGDFTAQAVADIRAAMDHLERTTDVHRFVIAGICSGADNGLAAALADDRVVGLCLLDGYTYPTAKTRWVRLKRRLRGPLLSAVVPWALRRLTALSVAIARRRGDALALVDNDRRFPSREEFAKSMQTLVDRGVEVCLVYSGSLLPQYNYDDQFRDAFAQYGFATRVRSEIPPGHRPLGDAGGGAAAVAGAGERGGPARCRSRPDGTRPEVKTMSHPGLRQDEMLF